MSRPSGVRGILVAFAIAAWASGLGSIATSRPAFAALRTFELAWTSPGSAAARGTLTLDDAICINPGNNSLAGGPDGCIADLSFEVTGATTGNGRFTLDDLGDLLFNTGGVAIDYDLEVIGQSPSDINFFSAGSGPAPSGVGPLVMRPAGAGGSDDLALVSMTPLALPFESDAQKCADAIGKAGARYFAARHKVLQACRSALTRGNELFADAAKTVPVHCQPRFIASPFVAPSRTIGRIRTRRSFPEEGSRRAMPWSIESGTAAACYTACANVLPGAGFWPAAFSAMAGPALRAQA